MCCAPTESMYRGIAIEGMGRGGADNFLDLWTILDSRI